MTAQGWIKEAFDLVEANLNGQRDRAHSHFRRQTFEALGGMTVPTRRDEDWRYLGLGKIWQSGFRQPSGEVAVSDVWKRYSVPGLNAIEIVLVNGQLAAGAGVPTGLPKGVEIMPVHDAWDDPALRGRLESLTRMRGSADKNVFLQANLALARHGLLIKTARNACVDRPIHLLHLLESTDQHVFAHPQLFILADRGSEVNVVQTFAHAPGTADYMTNAAVWVEMAANAHVHHYRFQLEQSGAVHMSNVIVRQHEASTYHSYLLDTGGHIVRNNISTELAGSQTDTHLYGAFVTAADQQVDNQTFIDHAMPHCESSELYKGVLWGNSRGVFNGKVLVRQDAQKTNAYQQNSSLVLGPDAVMDSKPQLEIYADDVRCSHGATIGHLDETAVFYLCSRGIPKAQALRLLQLAFVGEAIDKMKDESLTAYARGLAEAALDGGSEGE